MKTSFEPSEMSNTVYMYTSSFLKALGLSVFLLWPLKHPFHVPSGKDGREMFTHKHLLIQKKRYTNRTWQLGHSAHGAHVHE